MNDANGDTISGATTGGITFEDKGADGQSFGYVPTAKVTRPDKPPTTPGPAPAGTRTSKSK
jgi:hypothetical protein